MLTYGRCRRIIAALPETGMFFRRLIGNRVGDCVKHLHLHRSSRIILFCRAISIATQVYFEETVNQEISA